MAFDPKAPLARQAYKRSKHAVVALAPSPFDDEHYLSKATTAGNFVRHDLDGKNVSGNSDYDLVTIPERKPVVTSFFNYYSTGGVGVSRKTREECIKYIGWPADHIAVIQMTFDPNDNSVKSEVVWTPS